MSHGLALREYLDYRVTAGTDELLWENNGWSVRGVLDGREMLLWTSLYVLKGFDGGPFSIDRAAVAQTMLLTADPGATLGSDNDFLAAGWEPGEFATWDDCVVAADERSVSWRALGREIITRPDSWHISGSHATVSMDIGLTPMSRALWLTPPDQTLHERHDRWFIANADAYGEVRIGGASHQVSGHAVHERHIHKGTTYDPVSLLRGEGITWHTGHHGEVSYAVLSRPTRGTTWAQLIVGGVIHDLRGSEHVTVRPLRTWVDPATRLSVPSAWQLTIAAPGVELSVTTEAQARAYYLWNYLRGGVTVLYWWLCRSHGKLKTKDGQLHLDLLRSEAHLNRTFYEPRNRS